MKKVVSLVGARPQFIKEAVVNEAVRRANAWEHVLVNSGQHYDFNMAGTFFDELNIPVPKYNMGVGSGTHAEQTADAMCKFETILLDEKPDMVLLYGDTNTTLAGAIAASKLGAKDIEAADYDNVAVDVARENIEKNHECENIKIFQSDLLKNMNGKADLIIANIIADIIIRMFNDVDNYLNQHGAILTSGIIADRIADVTKAAEEHGFMVEKMNEKAGWAAIIFRRKEDMQ